MKDRALVYGRWCLCLGFVADWTLRMAAANLWALVALGVAACAALWFYAWRTVDGFGDQG